MTADVRLSEGLPTVYYASEADLQNGVAELARLHGWRVQTEVVVPNWGRLDLVLHAREDVDDYALVVEFKLDLTRASTLRKAFQQADGYARWLAMQGHHARVWLAPAKCDWSAAADLEVAYGDSVNLVDCGRVLRFVTGYHGWDARQPRARVAATDLIRRARVATDALNTLKSHERRAARINRTHARAEVPVVAS